MAVQNKILIGFDRRIEKFFIISIDESTTFSSYAQGDYDAEHNQFVFSGVTKETNYDKSIPFRMVYKFETGRKFIYEYYLGDGGKERKLIKQVYIRQD